MNILDDAKAEDVVSINIAGKSALGDFMIIASGRSNRHVSAICDQILREVKKQGIGPANTEGQTGGDWVLIDAGDIIIHIFRPEVREFYNLEKMWKAPETEDETVH